LKHVLFLIVLIFTVSTTAFTSDFSDEKMDRFFIDLQQGEYREGITRLLEDSALEEQVLHVRQTMENWVNQFAQIRSLYGDYLGYEKVFVQKLGNIEETVYLVHCQTYPIQVVLT